MRNEGSQAVAYDEPLFPYLPLKKEENMNRNEYLKERHDKAKNSKGKRRKYGRIKQCLSRKNKGGGLVLNLLREIEDK